PPRAWTLTRTPTAQISRSKPDSLHRKPAGFTALVLHGYGLRECLPARPTSAASYPVSVRRVATLLHASFRQSLAVLPLRFASAPPPSGGPGAFPPQSAGHVLPPGRCAPPARWPAASLDRRCARCSGRRQVGTKGWSRWIEQRDGFGTAIRL